MRFAAGRFEWSYKRNFDCFPFYRTLPPYIKLIPYLGSCASEGNLAQGKKKASFRFKFCGKSFRQSLLCNVAFNSIRTKYLKQSRIRSPCTKQSIRRCSTMSSHFCCCLGALSSAFHSPWCHHVWRRRHGGFVFSASTLGHASLHQKLIETFMEP